MLEISDEMLSLIDSSKDIESLYRDVSVGIVRSAWLAIPKSKLKKLSRIVPWWSNKCKKAIKDRNRAFKGY